MITTKKNKKSIEEMAFDLEVINPVESKTMLGGNWYLDEVNVWNGYQDFSSSFDYYSDLFGSSDSANGPSGGIFPGGATGLHTHPTTVEQQLGSMGACVSYAMSYESGVLGHPITGLLMGAHNANVLGVQIQTALVDGFSPIESTKLIQSYFNTATVNNTTQVNAALDAGHDVLGNYNNHEVAIISHSGTQYTVADSNTGSYNTIQQSQIDFNNGVYSILSVKP